MERKIDSKRLNLLIKSHNLLEKTKKDFKKYEKERRQLYEFTVKENVNYKEWEDTLKSIDKSIKSNSQESWINI